MYEELDVEVTYRYYLALSQCLQARRLLATLAFVLQMVHASPTLSGDMM